MEDQHRETEIDLRQYLHILRRRWWIVLIAFVCWVGYQGYRTSRMTPIYECAATVLIEKDSPNILNVEEVLDLNARHSQFYETQYAILKSRSFARKVLERLDPESLENPPPRKLNWVQKLREEAYALLGEPRVPDLPTGLGEGFIFQNPAIDAFLSSVSIVPKDKTQLVHIYARSPDPVMAAQKANTLADVYVDENLRTKLDATREAQDWLDRQLAEAEAKMAASAKALRKFEEDQNVFSLEERKLSIARKIEDLNADMVQAKAERLRLEARFRQLEEYVSSQRRGGGGVDSVREIMENQLIQRLTAEAARLDAELSEMLKSITPKHPKVQRLQSQMSSMRERIIEEEEKIVQSVRHDYELALQRERELPAAIDDQRARVLALNEEAGKVGALQKEAEENARLFERLKSRRKETTLASELRFNNVRIIDRAVVARRPSYPKRGTNFAIAVLVGLALGAGLSFALEYLDRTVKSPDDLERQTGLPFLGPVPILEPGDGTEKSRDLITLREPKSRFAEAYRAIRTGVLFASPDDPPRTIMLTSPGPREGKTVTSANLAVTMAAAGKNVLLVDADMRKPRLHRVFGIQNSVGLSTLLGGENDIAMAMKKSPVTGLTIIPSGPIPPNPSELLGSHRMEKLLALLKERYDRVVIDCPPLISVTDASVLASKTDGVILVVRAGTTNKDVIRRAGRLLADVNAHVIGTVLNWMDVSKSSYYYSRYYENYYKSYYTEDGKKDVSPKGSRRGKKAIRA